MGAYAADVNKKLVVKTMHIFSFRMLRPNFVPAVPAINAPISGANIIT